MTETASSANSQDHLVLFIISIKGVGVDQKSLPAEVGNELRVLYPHQLALEIAASASRLPRSVAVYMYV